jgi:hypothetical protein
MGRVYFIILLIVLSVMPFFWHISLNVLWLVVPVILLIATINAFIR